jgi:hypothetical protein
VHRLAFRRCLQRSRPSGYYPSGLVCGEVRDIQVKKLIRMVHLGAPASVTVNHRGIERLAFGRALGRSDASLVFLWVAQEMCYE